MTRSMASIRRYSALFCLLVKNPTRYGFVGVRSYSRGKNQTTNKLEEEFEDEPRKNVRSLYRPNAQDHQQNRRATIKHTSNNSDPRKNTRYPYVQGDPLHEDAIKNNKTALSTLKDKDRNKDSKKLNTMKQQISISKTAGGLKYETLAEGDIRLGRTILDAKSSKLKTPGSTILLEGERLIKDALHLGAQAKALYYCDPKVLNSLSLLLVGHDDIPLYRISYKDMKVWSDAVTPSGILGVFQKPEEGQAISPAETTLPLTLILDSLRDPGNVGTLIRTAAAIGCEQVIAIKGTANIWDCKVLRSAMAGHFSVPIYSGLNWSDVPNYLQYNSQVFLANTWQSSVLASSFDERLLPEDLDRALEQSEDSDNDSNSDSDDDPQFRDNTSFHHHDNLRDNNLSSARDTPQTFERVPLRICDYSDIIIHQPSGDRPGVQSPPSAALVLGGETDGLSPLAKKFAYKHYGQYVSIPMVQSVNSLNTGIAGSIILYELRRKLLQMGLDRTNTSEGCK